MNMDPAQSLEQLYKTVSKRHVNVKAACPAQMNGVKGFLGMSSGVYVRVWFDTEIDSKTLFSSVSREKAKKKYEELRSKYGT